VSWRYFGCSVRGSSHARDELPCQDYSLLAEFEGGELLAIVSDGAGSARFSDTGSRLVCATIQEEVTSFLRDGGSVGALKPEQLDLWFGVVVSRIRLQAEAMNAEVRDFAATLALALIGPDASAFAQIGDGAIVVSRDAVYAPVFWPANGEYANTTYFVTDESAISNFHVECSSARVEEVAVFSDGLQMLALRFATKEAHGPFFEPLFARLRAEPAGESLVLGDLLREYLESPLITDRTDDDKSLLLGSRANAVSVVANSDVESEQAP
jgi:hypothetical protein